MGTRKKELWIKINKKMVFKRKNLRLKLANIVNNELMDKNELVERPKEREERVSTN